MICPVCGSDFIAMKWVRDYTIIWKVFKSYYRKPIKMLCIECHYKWSPINETHKSNS